MTATPLYGSILQALTRGSLTITEEFYRDNVDPRSSGALSQSTLLALGLPFFGDPHPENPNLIVSGVAVQRYGVTGAKYAYQYSPPEFAQQSSAAERQRVGTVSLDITTDREDVDVPLVVFSPEMATITNGDEQVEIAVAPSWAVSDRSFLYRAARITYTVNGPASDFGFSNDFGDVGITPDVLAQEGTIHTIGTMALLFLGVDVSWNTTSGEDRIYTFRYDWQYEEGLEAAETAYPDGWAAEPAFGTFDYGFGSVVSGYGKIDENPDDGSRLYGVALPYVQAPQPLRGVGHIGSGRYLIVPYCRMIVPTTASSGIPSPEFVPNPMYTRIDPNVWQSFPGVG
jgi:hypothetical protein